MATRIHVWPLWAAVCLGGYGVSAASAETLHLKDGRVLEANVLERTEEKVVVDWFGVRVTYWTTDIDQVEPSPQPVKAPRFLRSVSLPPSAGATLSDEQNALVEEVLRLSGLADQLRQAGPQMQAQWEERLQTDARMQRLSPGDRDAFQHLFEAADFEALYGPARDVIRKHFDQQHLSAVKAWLSSPVGRKIIRMEAEPADPETMRGFLGALELEPPPDTRLVLAQRINDAAHVTEAMTQVLSAGLVGMGRVSEAAGELEAGLTEVQQAFGERRDELEAAMLARALFTYRAASDGDLEQYAAFLESDDGQWFSRVTTDAISHAMGQLSEQMAGRLVSLLARTPQQAGARP